MRAIILAAGRGSRMRQLTDDRPKCLLLLRGRPLLEWQVEALHGGGVREIGIVTGYRREMLATLGFREFHNPRWQSTNMVSSLECASEWLSAEPCIVSYSDIFFGADAARLLVASDATLAITYDPNWLVLWQRRFDDPLVDAETFRIDAAGRLCEIGGKPSSASEIEGQYMGLLRFTPAAWSEVQRIRANMPTTARDSMHMTGTLQRVIEGGRVPVSTLPYRGDWGEIDSEEDLSTYQDRGPSD
jgi:choline kinase